MSDWLDLAAAPIKPDHGPDAETALAIKAWNLMGGKLDWLSIGHVAEYLGIFDVECLIRQCEAIRHHGQS